MPASVAIAAPKAPNVGTNTTAASSVVVMLDKSAMNPARGRSMAHSPLPATVLMPFIVALNASTYPPASDIDLHTTVNAEFAGGGSAALSAASTHPYLARPQWHFALYGRNGQLWADSVADTLRLVRANGEVVQYGAPEASGLYDAGAPTKALIACAFGAPAPEGLTARLAARVVAVTDAIYISAKTNQKLEVEDL